MRNSAKISASLRHTIFLRDGFTCKHCNVVGHPRKRPSKGYAYPTEKDGLFLTIDHILAKSNGGDNSENNLQTLCHDCNRVKSNHV